ncbi:MAG: hypothetical protein ABSH41_01410 [Syntrophobacteraceae bacterium]|jgi:hypothetical protein
MYQKPTSEKNIFSSLKQVYIGIVDIRKLHLTDESKLALYEGYEDETEGWRICNIPVKYDGIRALAWYSFHYSLFPVLKNNMSRLRAFEWLNCTPFFVSVSLYDETEEEIAAVAKDYTIMAEIISRELPRLMKLAEENVYFNEADWGPNYAETDKATYIIGMVYQNIKRMLSDPEYMHDVEYSSPADMADRAVSHIAWQLSEDPAAWRALGEED